MLYIHNDYYYTYIAGRYSFYGVATVSRIDKLYVSLTKEPYKRNDILQKIPTILSILLTVATSYIML